MHRCWSAQCLLRRCVGKLMQHAAHYRVGLVPLLIDRDAAWFDTDSDSLVNISKLQHKGVVGVSICPSLGVLFSIVFLIVI